MPLISAQKWSRISIKKEENRLFKKYRTRKPLKKHIELAKKILKDHGLKPRKKLVFILAVGLIGEDKENS